MKIIAVIYHSAQGHTGHVATHGAPAGAFAPGDVKTARMLGRHFASTLLRIAAASHAAGPQRRSA